MLLRETSLEVVGVDDPELRELLRRECIRVYSAFDAGLVGLVTEHTAKVAVILRATSAGTPSHLPDRPTKEDRVLIYAAPFDLESHLSKDPKSRVIDLLNAHVSALRAVAKKYDWSVEGIDRADTIARTEGVIARLHRKRKLSPSRRWIAQGEGWIDGQGMHLSLELLSAVDKSSIRREEQVQKGDWHRLNKAFVDVHWSGDTVQLRCKKGEEAYFLPSLSISNVEP